ncbi:MAG: GNAT family N-acetyltransferase [Eubacteriales bacterium]
MDICKPSEEYRIPSYITIRHDLRPGDLGSMISMHGRIYSLECGYNLKFEAYVCKTFYEFGREYQPDLDKFWLAESGDKMVGSIAVISRANNQAQLRWFLIDPEFRRLHLGSYLFNQVMMYCREMKFEKVFLFTTIEQKTALSMYGKAGFVLDHEEESQSEWGHPIRERKYVLELIRKP